MKQRFIFAAILTLALTSKVFAYDFSSVAPSGHTLYFNFSWDSTSVGVTFPGVFDYVNQSFANCWTGYSKPIGNLIIPDSVTYGGHTYSVVWIGYGAFYECSGISSITIPNTILEILSGAFYGCTGLSSITIPTSVLDIWGGAFSGCSNLSTVYYNAVNCESSGTLVGFERGIFSGCTNISYFYFGESVTIIPAYLFNGNNAIQTITIPNSVISIGGYAFKDCYELTSVVFNATNCSNVESHAFDGCNIRRLCVGDSVTVVPSGLISGCIGITTLDYNATNCTQASFGRCYSLATVNFGENITVVPQHMLQYCREIQSLSIPNTVISIGDFAFSGCSGLTSVTLPNTLSDIGNFTFEGCSGLTSVTLPETVTSIGSCAFWGCIGLTTITLPSTVSRIGSYAFRDCSGLTSMVLPNSITSIETGVFCNCRGLTSIPIGNSVTMIGNQAFQGCCGLTSITISSSIRKIGEQSFKDCSGLITVIIDSPNASIGKNAFEGCGNLATVNLSVDTIHESAFKNCDHITNITFGSDLTAIENDAFDGCTQVVRIVSKATNPPVVQSSTFSSLSNDVILNVPCDAANAYENAAYWFRFNIQEDLVYDFSATSSNPARGTVTIVTEPTCDYREAQVQANAYHGYHFDHWSDGNTDNPRYIVVLQDTHLVAYFASDNGEDEGIEEATEERVKLYQRNGQIVVEGAEGYPVYLYDVVGRLLATRRETAQEVLLDVPVSGAYLVKIGDAPARRIVVRR